MGFYEGEFAARLYGLTAGVSPRSVEPLNEGEGGDQAKGVEIHAVGTPQSGKKWGRKPEIPGWGDAYDHKNGDIW